MTGFSAHLDALLAIVARIKRVLPYSGIGTLESKWFKNPIRVGHDLAGTVMLMQMTRAVLAERIKNLKDDWRGL